MANPEKKKKTIFLMSQVRIIASAHPVSCIMKNILSGLENSGIWQFPRMLFLLVQI
jgi:hypothetical protein